ncbi:hypothetical protein GPJ56_003511 [Histomonas meleagridis]|uniref:uncharacterized protein n=1 Tax=Histomonas meleagridis TaxID=135588 RepID=UPI00355A2D81|nr:hypothetical protein GPJ56_003511 [Histomonas meleagridis]KAH0806398.1 hypothetical protein GO595_000773 [Histomonas meleagridis]
MPDIPISKLLLEFCRKDTQARNGSSEPPDPLDHNALYEYLLNIAENDLEQLSENFNRISHYKYVVPEFSILPDFVKEKIKKLTEEKSYSKNFEQKMQPFIRILSLLEGTNALDILEVAVNYVFHNIKKNNQFPMSFIHMFSDTVVEDFSKETFISVKDFFFDAFDTQQRSAAIAVFANLSADFERIDSSLDKQINNLIIDSLSSEEYDLQFSGLLLLQKYSRRFRYEPEIAPPTEDLLQLVLPFFNSSDQSLSEQCTKTIKSLIKFGIFISPESIQSILELFNQISQDYYQQYFQIIHQLFYPSNSDEEFDFVPDLKYLLPVREFLIGQITDEDSTVYSKSYCIDSISDLFSIRPTFVRKYYPMIFEKVQKIIKTKTYSVYYLITPFLIETYKHFPKYKTAISKLIISICDIFSNAKKNYSTSIDVCVDICTLIGMDAIEFLPTVSSFAIHAIGSNNDNESIRGCFAFLEMIPKLNDKVSNLVFEKCFTKAMTTKETGSLVVYVQLMQKLIKHHNITSKNKDKFSETILSMKHPLIGKVPPFSFPLFAKYINVYVAKCEKNLPKILLNYTTWLNKTKQFSGLLLKTINIALKRDIITDEAVVDIGKCCLNILKSSNLDKLNFVNANACFECLRIINETKNKLSPPFEQIIEQVIRFVNEFNEEQIGSVKMQRIVETFPKMCDLIFDVYAKNDEAEVDEEVMNLLVELLPFPPEVKCNKYIIDELIAIVQKEKFQFVKVKILRVFANLIAIEKKELEVFMLKEEMINKMIDVLRKEVEKDQNMFAKIVKHILNQKEKEKLEKLLK